jgi:hypothetical protein
VDRHELAAHEHIHEVVLADVTDADRLADRAAAAVAADDVGCDMRLRRPVACARDQRYAVLGFRQRVHAPPEPHCDMRPAAGLLEQQPFDVHLIDAMGRLGELIGRRPRSSQRDTLVARRRSAAGNLVGGEPGEIGDVERMIPRQPQLAYPIGQPELAKQLHRAGIVNVALGMPARLGFGVEHRRRHAVHVQVQGKRKADRSATDNGDGGRLLLSRHRRALLTQDVGRVGPASLVCKIGLGLWTSTRPKLGSARGRAGWRSKSPGARNPLGRQPGVYVSDQVAAACWDAANAS